jgi:elongation of very long chain fatty acids protein 6
VLSFVEPSSLLEGLEKVDQRRYVQYDYNYSMVFGLEKRYYSPKYTNARKDWIRDNWHYSLLFSALYITVIFGLRRFMEHRERLSLQTPLIVWNSILALFSIVGAVRYVPYMYYMLNAHGLNHSICKELEFYGVLACWGWQFMLSKVAELVDTLFVVLRKQKLIFLHWYHHATVLIYCWYSLSDMTSTSIWFCCMNYTVHAFMYTYYALRAMKIRIPKWVNVMITTMQLAQMVWGVFINVYVYNRKLSGGACSVSYNNLYWASFMYLTYFLLFFNYFYHAYLKKAPRGAKANGSATSKDD